MPGCRRTSLAMNHKGRSAVICSASRMKGTGLRSEGEGVELIVLHALVVRPMGAGREGRGGGGSKIKVATHAIDFFC